MKISKKIVLLSVLMLLLFNAFTFKVLAGDSSYGLNTTVGTNDRLKKAFSFDAVGADSGKFLSTRVGTIIGTLLSFLGVLFMALVIYAGILWMTARGNEAQVDKAKNLLVNAIIGLIIVLAAYAITAFIGGQLTDIQPAAN